MQFYDFTTQIERNDSTIILSRILDFRILDFTILKAMILRFAILPWRFRSDSESWLWQLTSGSLGTTTPSKHWSWLSRRPSMAKNAWLRPGLSSRSSPHHPTWSLSPRHLHMLHPRLLLRRCHSTWREDAGSNRHYHCFECECMRVSKPCQNWWRHLTHGSDMNQCYLLRLLLNQCFKKTIIKWWYFVTLTTIVVDFFNFLEKIR